MIRNDAELTTARKRVATLEQLPCPSVPADVPAGLRTDLMFATKGPNPACRPRSDQVLHVRPRIVARRVYHLGV